MIRGFVDSLGQAFDFNAATLSGCIDIIVVPQEDGSLKSTPFHVRFGKQKVLRSRDKVVELWVNERDTGIRMTLGAAGEAFFDDESIPDLDASSSANEAQVVERIAQNEKAIAGLTLAFEENLNTILDTSAPVSPTVTTPRELNATERLLAIASRLESLDIEFSLCGEVLEGNETQKTAVFEDHIITFDEMMQNSELWYHPSMMARFNKENHYYPAKAVYPVLLSPIIFKRTIDSEAARTLLSAHGPTPDILITPLHNPTPSPVESQRLESDESGKSIDVPSERRPPAMQTPAGGVMTPSASDFANFPSASDFANFEAIEALIDNTEVEAVIETPLGEEVNNIRQTLRPTKQQLLAMDLNWGLNNIEFRLAGTNQSVEGSISLWERDAKIVISDVDGTITKSDVAGMLAPMVGKDWTHTAVAKLFNRIQKSGFHMLYLTARAIGQADRTRDYLFRLADSGGDAGQVLPHGPLFLSPDRLFASTKREVYDRTPFIFKIAALRDIRSLFPSNYNPFYAGFGNRDTDHKAYTHIGIPEGKVFIINVDGVIHHVNSAYATSYDSMADIAHQMFPHLHYTRQRHSGLYDHLLFRKNLQKCDSHHIDAYNDYNFWQPSLPEIDTTSSTSSEEPSVNDIENNDDAKVRRLSSVSDRERPVSRELIGLRRKLLYSKSIKSADDFDVQKAVRVTPFAELAKMYSALDNCVNDEQQAILLSEMEECGDDFEKLINKYISGSIGEDEIDEGLREVADDMDVSKGLTKLSDSLWNNMIREKELGDGDTSQVWADIAQILNYPLPPEELEPAEAQELIDPGVATLEPVDVNISMFSPSALLGWR